MIVLHLRKVSLPYPRCNCCGHRVSQVWCVDLGDFFPDSERFHAPYVCDVCGSEINRCEVPFSFEGSSHVRS